MASSCLSEHPLTPQLRSDNSFLITIYRFLLDLLAVRIWTCVFKCLTEATQTKSRENWPFLLSILVSVYSAEGYHAPHLQCELTMIKDHSKSQNKVLESLMEKKKSINLIAGCVIYDRYSLGEDDSGGEHYRTICKEKRSAFVWNKVLKEKLGFENLFSSNLQDTGCSNFPVSI